MKFLGSSINIITRGQTAVERVLTGIGAAIVMVMMFLTSLDVILRYIFKSPLGGAYELQEFLLVGVVFLGLGDIQAMKGHLNVDLLTSRLSPRMQIFFGIVGYVISLVIFSLITWQSGLRAWKAFDTGQIREGIVGYPLWPAKSMIPVGTAFLCLRLIRDIIIDSRRLKTNTENLPECGS